MYYLYAYIVCFIIITLMILVAYFKRRAVIYRIAFQLLLIWNLLAFYNMEDRKRFDDLGDKVAFLSF